MRQKNYFLEIKGEGQGGEDNMAQYSRVNARLSFYASPIKSSIRGTVLPRNL